MTPSRRRGFTLVECLGACALAAVLAAVAWPTLRGHGLRAARLDAVQALTRLQSVQEQYRALHGLYAAELSVLRGVSPVSDQGRYMLALERTGPESYRATAQARGAQSRDHECGALTLDVQLGFATAGPGPQCWNR
ncbi:MAG: type IV pilin protein [Rubrivivax sp.]|nr:type IV pilin protein [Rubrivivax sp.]